MIIQEFYQFCFIWKNPPNLSFLFDICNENIALEYDKNTFCIARTTF